MNVKVLIDSIVRQTTVLIAQLATAAGIRAPLAHIANEVFLDLVRELESQGVGRKVIADMFGLALRSYQLKVQRLSEGATVRDRSLWEVALDELRERGVATRAELLQRFFRDDEATVRGILHDLVESGLVFRAGRGDRTIYRVASQEELGRVVAGAADEGIDELVWVTVYWHGPIDRDSLLEKIPVEKTALDAALDRLVAAGRIEAEAPDEEAGEQQYRCQLCVIPLGSPAGWEAALFDHFQAVVNAIGIKLRDGVTRTLPVDLVGGSTYSFDVWPGHPHEARVLGLLRDTRSEVSALRSEVSAHNDENGRPAEGYRRVTFYFGQSVRDEPEASPNGEEA